MQLAAQRNLTSEIISLRWRSIEATPQAFKNQIFIQAEILIDWSLAGSRFLGLFSRHAAENRISLPPPEKNPGCANDNASTFFQSMSVNKIRCIRSDNQYGGNDLLFSFYYKLNSN